LIDWWQWLAVNGCFVRFGVARAWYWHVVPVLRSLVTMACAGWMHATATKGHKQKQKEQNKRYEYALHVFSPFG
jgi:hypothetical protein